MKIDIGTGGSRDTSTGGPGSRPGRSAVDERGRLPDKDATAQRLLQNQADLGNAIKPVHGQAAGDKLTAPLKDHIMISTEIIDAAKAGDTAKKDEAANRWNANADDIATFLSDANPKNRPVAERKKNDARTSRSNDRRGGGPFARRLGGGHRGLRESSHTDSENGRHVEYRNYQTVSE